MQHKLLLTKIPGMLSRSCLVPAHEPRYLECQCAVRVWASSFVIGVCYGCLVAEDIGTHQLERLVELLTPQECKDLLRTLSHPEENIFQRVERLSPEQNQLDLKPRAKRDTSSVAG